jgi:predicted fused transcriptional regulator/phosphomethylpyrimidine kinase/predicted transcriptional regulator
LIVYKFINKSLIVESDMLPPAELMTKHILPALRGLITHTLTEKEYSQSRIAIILGITQASVSLYLSNEPSFYKEKMREIGVKDSDTDRYVEMLFEDLLRGRVEAIYTISSIWRNLLASGLLCPAHKREASILEDCDVCMRLYGPLQGDAQKNEVLREVERAAKMVEDSPFFQYVMPEVSVNTVMALKDAKTEADVVAFPGRIVKIHGRAKHIQSAEFSASRHMARMLLTIMQLSPDLRAAINIKYDDRVDGTLSNMNLSCIRISSEDHKPSMEGDVVVSAFKTKLSKDGNVVHSIVVDEGGEGLEPITYMFGKNATEVAKQALEIAKKYAE